MSSRFAFATVVLWATFGAALLACSGGSSSDSADATPTGTPHYAGTELIPTVLPQSGLPTPENNPPPTVTGQPTTTASGLQIYDIQTGTGAVAQPNGIVYVNYTIWVQGGNEVDRNRLDTVRFRLVKGQTLDGLVEGIPGMAVGGKRRLIIPPALAYGSTGSGNVIPPNATLIYDIELTDVSNPTP